MNELLLQKLEALQAKHQKLAQSLSDSAVVQNLPEFRTLSKEYARLSPVVEGLQRYQAAQNNLQSYEALLQDNDPEIQALAAKELNDVKMTLQTLERELEILLISRDPNDVRNVFIEIRAAAGGAEAAIFAGDLFRMYSRYAQSQGWNIEILSNHEGEQGGYKEIIVRLAGQDVYSHLKFESGAHRVQRIPTTEAQGRLHTSTCTVAILPEVEAIDNITINPAELRIDTFRASGAGGQHVQKTDSAIRIVHLPTGVTVECQDERSQHKNRARAMSLLQAKLLAASRNKQQQEEAETRRSLVGSGDRSERIRTYNIPQMRLTDHRINFSVYQLDAILEGKLSIVIEPLQRHDQAEQLSTYGS